eukprot:358867-Chlamydomonas_euryale.AAC.2
MTLSIAEHMHAPTFRKEVFSRAVSERASWPSSSVSAKVFEVPWVEDEFVRLVERQPVAILGGATAADQRSDLYVILPPLVAALVYVKVAARKVRCMCALRSPYGLAEARCRQFALTRGPFPIALLATSHHMTAHFRTQKTCRKRRTVS